MVTRSWVTSTRGTDACRVRTYLDGIRCASRESFARDTAVGQRAGEVSGSGGSLQRDLAARFGENSRESADTTNLCVVVPCISASEPAASAFARAKVLR